MEMQVANEDEKIDIIKKLIDKKALFMYGHGWYPSELIEYLKDKGVQFKKYSVIYWRGKDDYSIEER